MRSYLPTDLASQVVITAESKRSSGAQNIMDKVAKTVDPTLAAVFDSS